MREFDTQHPRRGVGEVRFLQFDHRPRNAAELAAVRNDVRGFIWQNNVFRHHLLGGDRDVNLRVGNPNDPRLKTALAAVMAGANKTGLRQQGKFVRFIEMTFGPVSF